FADSVRAAPADRFANIFLVTPRVPRVSCGEHPVNHLCSRGSAHGTDHDRQNYSGKGATGDWTIHRVELSGSEGRTVSVVVNDPSLVPAKGEVFVLPVYVGKNGDIREARSLAEESSKD